LEQQQCRYEKTRVLGNSLVTSANGRSLAANFD
jgi:hypothetical protein